MQKKAVVLFSGGLDSSTCLAVARDQGFSCYALTFNYGQRNNSELAAAERYAKLESVAEHKIITIPLNSWGGSALTDFSLDVPQYKGDGNIPITYVPARNIIFLSLAVAWAEVLDARDIFLGVNAVDYAGYPDCRPEFIAAFQNMVNMGTVTGNAGRAFTIQTPLINLHKADIVKLGTQLGIDYSKTVSCYQATEEGHACGECDSCYLRKKGFKEAGIADPTNYQYYTSPLVGEVAVR
jgi:7-cyano-7-deazaguanine synthase